MKTIIFTTKIIIVNECSHYFRRLDLKKLFERVLNREPITKFKRILLSNQFDGKIIKKLSELMIDISEFT